MSVGSRGCTVSFGQWVDVYEAAWRDGSTLWKQQCPGCGRADLNLVFTAHLEPSTAVRAALWCAACLRGIHLGNASRPRTGKVWTLEEAQSASLVPNYALIPPDWE